MAGFMAGLNPAIQPGHDELGKLGASIATGWPGTVVE